MNRIDGALIEVSPLGLDRVGYELAGARELVTHVQLQ